MDNNTINNVDIDKLPDFVQDVILREFAELPIKHKLIVYTKLVHGHLFKVTSNDLFNINKQTPGNVYRAFIKTITEELELEDEYYKRISSKENKKKLDT
jgi:hypothetical protein